MADTGGEYTLIKIAIFCVVMSLVSTALLTMYVAGSSDYDYDTVTGYKAELVEFSGGKLVNDNPWVLSGVYTAFTPGSIPDNEIPNHIEDDNGQSIGWLYGESIDYWPYIGEVTGIKLNSGEKSDQLLSIGNAVNWEYENGREWWAGGNEYGIDLSNVGRWFLSAFNEYPGDSYGAIYESGTANTWEYSGWRYVWDPVLPFSNEGSSKDGRLSVVWYDIPNEGSGLSGALEVYGGSKNDNMVKLGSISSSDIVSAFRSTAGYTQVFDFKFEGTHLNLTIQFDPTVYSTYNSLQDAWNAGAWSMAISSASAGNFFDVENSNAFNTTAGSMFDSFISIYTFSYPHFNDNEWAEFVMWLLVGFPMTLALLFVTLHMVGGVFKIF